MKMHILIGPTGCGKTTYRKANSKLAGLPCVSPDDFIVGKWTPAKAQLAWSFAEKMAKELMGENTEFVVDAQFINGDTRRRWRNMARHFDYDVTATVFKTPWKQLLKNHKQRGNRGNYGSIPFVVIRNAHNSFQRLIEDENAFKSFDSVCFVEWSSIS